MALIKSFDTNYGVPATHWYTVELNTNWFAKSAMITLAGYTSKEAADSGKTAICMKSYPIREDKFDLLFNMANLNTEGVNPVLAVYMYIKSLPEWAGAEDLIYPSSNETPPAGA